MTGPLGNSEFCFPRISMFPLTSSRETKFTVPLGTMQSLSVNYNSHMSSDLTNVLHLTANKIMYMYATVSVKNDNLQ